MLNLNFSILVIFLSFYVNSWSTTLTENDNEKLLHLSDPKQSILQAWNDLEIAAKRKLDELQIDLRKNGFKNTELSYFEYKGALPPKTEAAIQNMRILRNQIAHYPSKAISEKDAHDFINVVKKIEKTIDAIHNLPAVELHAICSGSHL